MSLYIWLGVAALAAVIEALSLGLISLWFIIGALISFVLALLGVPEAIQVAAFLIVSVACLVLLRPVVLKYRNTGASKEPTMVGQTAVVTETIGPDGRSGRVETSDRLTWTALLKDDSTAEAGEQVVVVDQQSVKLIVERKRS